MMEDHTKRKEKMKMKKRQTFLHRVLDGSSLHIQPDLEHIMINIRLVLSRHIHDIQGQNCQRKKKQNPFMNNPSASQRMIFSSHSQDILCTTTSKLILIFCPRLLSTTSSGVTSMDRYRENSEITSTKINTALTMLTV